MSRTENGHQSRIEIAIKNRGLEGTFKVTKVPERFRVTLQDLDDMEREMRAMSGKSCSYRHPRGW